MGVPCVRVVIMRGMRTVCGWVCVEAGWSYIGVKVCRYGKIWTDLRHVGLKDLLNPVTCN